MTKVFLAFAAFLTVLMVGAVLLYQYFGVWGLVGAIAIASLSLAMAPRVIAWIIMRGLRKSMSSLAVALRGATVEVHSVESATEPPPEEYDEEHGYDDDEQEFTDGESDDENSNQERDAIQESGLMDPGMENLFYDGARNWYYVDLTVYPAMRTDGRPTEYLPWTPQMISFHGPPRTAPKNFSMMPFPEMADGCCEVHEVIPAGGETEELDDREQVFGPQRLRFHIGVQPKMKMLRIMYVCETIGELSLPNN